MAVVTRHRPGFERIAMLLKLNVRPQKRGAPPQLAVGVDGSSRTLGKCPPGDISTLVNEALLKALAAYYSKWEGLQQRWR